MKRIALRLVWIVAVSAGVFALQLFTFNLQDSIQELLIQAGVAIILAVSLTMVNGFTGQFSIGHAGFMAVGGYTAGWITYYGSIKLWGAALAHGGAISGLRGWQSGMPLVASGDLMFLGAALAGGVVAAALGLVVGLPSLRLRGDYLAIVTLGFGGIVRVTIQQTNEVLSPEDTLGCSLPKLTTHVGGALGFTGLPSYTTLFWVYLFVAA